METAYSNTNSIDIALWIWFALTAVSVVFVAWDLLTPTPEKMSEMPMQNMKY